MNDYRYEIRFVLDKSGYLNALQWSYERTNAVNKYAHEILPDAGQVKAG